jgi:hypothetical protein
MRKVAVAVLVAVLLALCVGVAEARVVVGEPFDPSFLKLHRYTPPYRLHQYHYHLYPTNIPTFGIVQPWNISSLHLYQPYLGMLKLHTYYVTLYNVTANGTQENSGILWS